MFLNELPMESSTLIGVQDQTRPFNCRKCQENRGVLTKLLHPTSLAVSNDGTIYVFDLNIIWMFRFGTGLTKPVAEFDGETLLKFHLATDPVNGRLYVADANRRQIIRLIKQENIDDLRENYEIVVGNGGFCAFDPINNVTCGDGALASDVEISTLKGLTIDRDGTMFFVDGQRIRKVNVHDSRVTTLVGSNNDNHDFQREFLCERFYPMEKVKISTTIDFCL